MGRGREQVVWIREDEMSSGLRAVAMGDVPGGPNSTWCLSRCGATEASTLNTELMLLPLTERISMRGSRVSLTDIPPMQGPIARVWG